MSELPRSIRATPGANTTPGLFGLTPPMFVGPSAPAGFSGRLPALLRLRRTRSYRRILDPELVEIRLVLRRIEVVLLHLGPVLRHDLLVEPDGRLVFRANQRDVFLVLG